jgi:hypothetical protein
MVMLASEVCEVVQAVSHACTRDIAQVELLIQWRPRRRSAK